MRGDGIRARKALGQNFLTDRSVLSRIAALVSAGAGERILEIGPGKGALTSYLAEQAGQLVAVELDNRLVPLLRGSFSGNPSVTIIEGDILDLDLRETLGRYGTPPWKVAANLPYNISTPVLFRLLDARDLFSRLVLMLQKEVGNRLAAGPGSKEYGVLSVLFQLHFDVTREILVRPGSFHPVPKVDSVVLLFVPLAQPRVDVGDEDYFRRVVKASFAMRRKTLWNCLKGGALGVPTDGIRDVLARCGIDEGRRGETLSLHEFASLTKELMAAGGSL
ncbi:16S rRNA (adenine(1518)-N(6)/adenine(1519)-N(6))-dimethyltransferase RsmA [Geobacter sulfurreducens]|uniref:16S rRNA (adenine(1518)-N(6)/adenine(1519)-N(6))- dimethyltransferase RsmA n=1 Tax=Geobacter sulfurreducens TaxID=35554 RepID=UPI001BDD0D26|nr:16S rRNA (adenine(1518)-N(6)/adenine(1519)-N(6))-dimethyltransferase RsmA [Geobacter sulfurreducens]QVW33821.1 16S rRNA (adenine(1518)-N(6)/adenine(1519)-N(6))-dimethyltransferase RsmA [Geobacter sulfurreducens]